MAAGQQRLSFTVAILLLEVFCDSGAPVMPDKASRGKPEFVTALLHSPADIHIITSFAEDRVEPSIFFKHPFVKGHVAPGDMLRQTIGDHDMRWATRRHHHRRGYPRVFRWQKIVPSDARKLRVQ